MTVPIASGNCEHIHSIKVPPQKCMGPLVAPCGTLLKVTPSLHFKGEI